MTEENELIKEVKFLRAEIAALREQIGTIGLRLGPQRETLEDINRRGERLVAEIKRARAEVAPVDRSARVLVDGSPVTDDHRELLPSGQQKGYVVLSAEERAKGFVRPVRQSYRHTTCGTLTTMALPLAETYARDPGFYSGTFCVACSSHFPLDQFVWDGTTEQLGS